jgi:hypothetical protein
VAGGLRSTGLPGVKRARIDGEVVQSSRVVSEGDGRNMEGRTKSRAAAWERAEL